MNRTHIELLNEEYPIEDYQIEELFDFFKKNFLIIGDYKIEYRGEDVDTINGRTETWIITRKLPYLKKEIKNE